MSLEICISSSKEIDMKMSSANWRLLRLGPNELICKWQHRPEQWFAVGYECVFILRQNGQWLNLLWLWELSTFDILNSLRSSDMSRKSNHHWFIWWLVARSAPGHCLIQWLNNVNWTCKCRRQTAAFLSRPRYVKYSLVNALCYVIIICRVRMCVYTIQTNQCLNLLWSCELSTFNILNSLQPDEWCALVIKPSLVQMMDCRRVGTKTLFDPMFE